MSIKNPVHPGLIVKYDCLESLNLSVTEGAKILGVARPTLSRVINGKSAISPEMAVRLSKAFGSTPECWLRLQLAYDVAQVKASADTINIPRYRPAPDTHPSLPA